MCLNMMNFFYKKSFAILVLRTGNREKELSGTRIRQIRLETDYLTIIKHPDVWSTYKERFFNQRRLFFGSALSG
jgi:hypothetical protein